MHRRDTSWNNVAIKISICTRGVLSLPQIVDRLPFRQEPTQAKRRKKGHTYNQRRGKEKPDATATSNTLTQYGPRRNQNTSVPPAIRGLERAERSCLTFFRTRVWIAKHKSCKWVCVCGGGCLSPLAGNKLAETTGKEMCKTRVIRFSPYEFVRRTRPKKSKRQEFKSKQMLIYRKSFMQVFSI